LVKGPERFAEAGSVLLRDREDAVTALGAAGAAGEVLAAALGGGGEGGVYDLDEGGHRAIVRCPDRAVSQNQPGA
jgi:hypothetical protein